MKNVTKSLAVSAAVVGLTGCAEMVAFSGAALTGMGLAEGDFATAALGTIAMDAGISASTNSDYKVSDSVANGVIAGTAAETGNVALLGVTNPDVFSSTGVAGGTAGAIRAGDVDFDAGIPGDGTGNGAGASGDRTGNGAGFDISSGSPTSGSCRAKEQEVQRKINDLQRRMNSTSSICEQARLARELARIGLDYNNTCPINDPTGEMRQYLNELADWANQTERQVCVNGGY